MSIEYRFAAADEYPRISAFLDKYWAHDHIYVRKPELFEWTFRRPGFWPVGEYSFSVAEDAGALVGILGGIPYDLNCYGARRRGIWIVNFAVRPDYRKGPAALRLLSTFRNPAFPVVIASGLNQATVAIYQVLRGQVLPEPPRHVAVLPEAIDRMAGLIRLANPEWDSSHARDLARAFAWPQVAAPSAEVSCYLPGSWDTLDWPRIAATSVGACRDLDYLTWRYRNHPLFTYRFLTVADGPATSLLVWRLEAATQQCAGRRVEADLMGRVVEFLPSSQAGGASLLAALQTQLRECGALGADFYTYHAGYRRALADSSFHPASLHPEGHAIPSRLQPIEASGPALNAMFAAADLPPCGPINDCVWYWTRSDSDQDRPN